MNIGLQKWIILIVLSLTWGSSFILIKQSLLSFTPLQVGGLRLAFAGLVLTFFGIPNIRKIPKNKWGWLFIVMLGNFIPMFLFPIAQTRVNSSFAGILDSLVPIFVLIFGYSFFREKSSLKRVLGAFIGFIGAVILMKGEGNEEGESSFFYALLIVLATAFYGMNALVISKYLNEIPSFRLSSVIFTICLPPALLVLYLSGFFQDFTGSEQQWEGLKYVSILGLVGTAIAMILYYYLIQLTSAVFASTVTYLMPVIALIWGILDGEKPTYIHVLGFVLILSGVYLIQEKTKEKQFI